MFLKNTHKQTLDNIFNATKLYDHFLNENEIFLWERGV